MNTLGRPFDEQLRDRFRGALVGVAIGDALGAPFEGTGLVDRGALDRRIDQPGRMQWTDDTHMTIGMAESLIACRGFDGDHMANHFAQRYAQEPWRGYGAGPPQVFAALQRGARWDEAGCELFDGSGSYGNGAAMRVAPAAMIAYHDLDKVADLARETAIITHAHEWGIEGAVVQAVTMAWLLQQSPGEVPNRAELLKTLRQFVRSRLFHRAMDELEGLSTETPPEQVALHLGNSIEAVRSVPSAVFAFLRSPDDFAETVLFAISLGGDADTIASMAGALAGAHSGTSAMPAAWRHEVEAGDHLSQLADQLFEIREAGGK